MLSSAHATLKQWRDLHYASKWSGQSSILCVQVDHIAAYSGIQLSFNHENLGYSFKQYFWCSGWSIALSILTKGLLTKSWSTRRNLYWVQEMLLRVCCAMLLCIKSRLLSGDFAANLKLLQHYPEINIEHLLQVAQDLSPDTSSFRLSM